MRIRGIGDHKSALNKYFADRQKDIRWITCYIHHEENRDEVGWSPIETADKLIKYLSEVYSNQNGDSVDLENVDPYEVFEDIDSDTNISLDIEDNGTYLYIKMNSHLDDEYGGCPLLDMELKVYEL